MTIELLAAIRSRTKVATHTEYTLAPTVAPEPAHRAVAPLAQLVGGVHWKIRDIEALATLLQSMGYIELAPEAPNEYSRLWKPCHGSIIIKRNGWASARSGGFVDLAEIRKAGL